MLHDYANALSHEAVKFIEENKGEVVLSRWPWASNWYCRFYIEHNGVKIEARREGVSPAEAICTAGDLFMALVNPNVALILPSTDLYQQEKPTRVLEYTEPDDEMPF